MRPASPAKFSLLFVGTRPPRSGYRHGISTPSFSVSLLPSVSLFLLVSRPFPTPLCLIRGPLFSGRGSIDPTGTGNTHVRPIPSPKPSSSTVRHVRALSSDFTLRHSRFLLCRSRKCKNWNYRRDTPRYFSE